MNRVARVMGALAIAGVLLMCLLAAPRGLYSQVPRVQCANLAVHIDKTEGVLELLCGSNVEARFLATFGAEPRGPKLREGDERTPEGNYQISSRRETTRFHRFLGVSYPNAADRERARLAGVTNLGGAIGIHGVERARAAPARIWTRAAHALGLFRLWGPTDGCIALTNEDVEVVYDAVRVGTPVRIDP